MSRPPQLARELRIAPALLPARAGESCLGTVLLFNTLRRAFARLAEDPGTAEPDWGDMLGRLTASGRLSEAVLTAPARHPGLAALVEVLPDHPPGLVQAEYARAFRGELAAGEVVYVGFLTACGLSAGAVAALLDAARHERLLRAIEAPAALHAADGDRHLQ